ncbi:unnamed protein product [Diamesa tonsa]
MEQQKRIVCLLALVCHLSVVLAGGDGSPCFLEPDAGMCMAYFTYWYYNHQTGSCSEFIYGGCGGNGNKFETREECMVKCHQ